MPTKQLAAAVVGALHLEQLFEVLAPIRWTGGGGSVEALISALKGSCIATLMGAHS
jgi:formiminotetrahydrofolate cyclodeaminase